MFDLLSDIALINFNAFFSSRLSFFNVMRGVNQAAHYLAILSS